MRVAFVTWDGGGNRQPFEVLGSALVERGDELHVVSNESHRSLFESIASFHPLPVSAPHPPGERPPESEALQRAIALVRSPVVGETTFGLLNAVQFDVVAMDMAFAAAFAACEATGTPFVVVHHSLPGALWNARRSQLETSVGGVNDTRRLLGLEPLDSYGDVMATAKAHLAPTSAMLDAPLPWELPMHYVGPLQPVGGAEIPELPERFVLVSLSTTWQDQLDVLQRIIDSLSGIDRDIVVTTGPSIGPGELRSARNTVLLAHVPHLRVLDRVDAVVTHAGHGTVISALTAGVPLVCMPMGRDQHQVTQRVVAVGAGVEIAPNSVADELLPALQRVLADPSFADRARQVARSIATHGGVDEALAVLDRCAHEPGSC